MAKFVTYPRETEEVIAMAIKEYREWLFGPSYSNLPTPGDENLAMRIYEALKANGKVD